MAALFGASFIPLKVTSKSHLNKGVEAFGGNPLAIGATSRRFLDKVCDVDIKQLDDFPRIEVQDSLTFVDGLSNTVALLGVSAVCMFTSSFVLVLMAVVVFGYGIMHGQLSTALLGPPIMLLMALLGCILVIVMMLVSYGSLAFQTASVGYYIVFAPLGLIAVILGLVVGAGPSSNIIGILIIFKE